MDATPTPKDAPPGPRRVPTLGLLGAPGAGKSHAARAFAQLGAAVIDADALARAELDAPAVARTLAEWWGPEVLAAGGGVDRVAVARRVFGDDAAAAVERARLEGLIHPRVNAARAAALARHRADPSVAAVVEDCPLLLERGLEGGCDVLVLVETPQAVRRERVARGRGWDTDELARREKSQLPLDTKRRRADYVLDGTAGPSVMLDACRQVLAGLGVSPDTAPQE